MTWAVCNPLAPIKTKCWEPLWGQVVPCIRHLSGKVLVSHTISCPALFCRLLPTTPFSKILAGIFFSPLRKKNLPHLKIRKNSELSYRFPNDLTRTFIWSLTAQTTPWPSGCWNWDLPEKARDVVWTIAPDFLLLEGATESCLLLFREWEFRLRFIKVSHFIPPEVFPFRICNSCYYVFNFSANICACM